MSIFEEYGAIKTVKFGKSKVTSIIYLPDLAEHAGKCTQLNKIILMK